MNMTFRERLEQEHPDMINKNFNGGCVGCPDNYGYCEKSSLDRICEDYAYTCYDCWDLECPTTPTVPTPDMVNHPSHYETGKFECIEVMEEALGIEAVKDFCICNAFKYIYRHKNKNGMEDIEKAIWYLNKFKELHSKED